MSKRCRKAKTFRNYAHVIVSPQVDTIDECMDDPLAEKCFPQIPTEQQSLTNSDCEDFLGFESTDIKRKVVNASTGEVYVVFECGSSDGNHLNQLDDADVNQSDDDLIIVENNVEVIEIADDEDDKTTPPSPLPTEPTTLMQYSIRNLRGMMYCNHPQMEFRKPNLNWKSDHFRLVYVNGIKQNAFVCTKCEQLFIEINIDTIVEHSRCRPPPVILPIFKRTKIINREGNSAQSSESSEISKFGISKIQTVAACIDIQSTSLYQSNSFRNFAKFLVNTGANTCNQFKPKYDDLSKFSNQLKDSQQSKIRSILNTPGQDFSFSCDVWADAIRQKTNVALELHYLNSNFSRHRVVIGVRTINGTEVDGKSVYEQVIEILKIYSIVDSGVEFIQKAVAFVTLGKLQIPMDNNACFQSACGIINDIANDVVNEQQLSVSIHETCIHIVALLNHFSSEKVFEFNGKKWENVYKLMKTFQEKKPLIMGQKITANIPNEQPFIKLLEPFHMAVRGLDDSKNNATNVFVVYNCLANHLAPYPNDKDILKIVKAKALTRLTKAFADSDLYQVSMFLDPFNRKHYDSLESDKMDEIQSKVEALINRPKTHSVEIDLLEYMDDNVISKPNEIDLFLECTSSSGDIFEYWRDSERMPELKKLARKYLTIPTYASLSECVLNKVARKFLTNRNNLEIKDLETMLMMNSFGLDGKDIILNR